MFRNILVPLDESKYAERALSLAADMAKQSGGEINLITVVPDHPHSSNELIRQIEAERPQRAEAYLETRAAELRSRGFEAVHVQVSYGEAADAITDAATQSGADLIAMSTHGLGNTGRYAMGSVALKVLMTAPCPVLMVRVQEAWDPAEH